MDKIICLGKNYLDHAAELGDAIPEKPVLFLKPPSSAIWVKEVGDLVQVELPRNRGAVHHECEIVLLMGAHRKIKAVTLGLDLTLRDVQTELKKKGHPWEIGKVFKNAAVIGPWINLQEYPQYLTEVFSFSLEGKVRQKSTGAQMTFSPDENIAYLSEFFEPLEGDVVFTGTPAGVGAVSSGERGELHWGKQLLFRVEFL